MKLFHGCLLSFFLPLFFQPLLAQPNNTISPGQILLSINVSVLLEGVGGGKPIQLVGGGFTGGPGGGFWGGGGSSAISLIVLADRPPDQDQNPLNGNTPGKGSGQTTKEGASHSPGECSSEGQDAAGGQQPLQGGGLESSLAEFESLLAQLDQLMEQFTGEVVLLTDLDDTLLPQDREECRRQKQLRVQFTAFVEKWRKEKKLKVIVVTRAQLLAKNWGHFASFQLPEPDVLISQGFGLLAPLHVQARQGVVLRYELAPEQPLIDGIFRSPDGFTIRNYSHFIISSQGDLSSLFSELGYLIEDAQYQEVKGRYAGFVIRFSPELDLSSAEVQSRIRRRVFDIYGIMAEAIFAPVNQVVYLRLPFRKVGLVNRLAGALSLPGATVIAAGDTIDDFSMLLPDEYMDYQVHTAIIVDNGSQNLKEAARRHPS